MFAEHVEEPGESPPCSIFAGDYNAEGYVPQVPMAHVLRILLTLPQKPRQDVFFVHLQEETVKRDGGINPLHIGTS